MGAMEEFEKFKIEQEAWLQRKLEEIDKAKILDEMKPLAKESVTKDCQMLIRMEKARYEDLAVAQEKANASARRLEELRKSQR